MGTLLQDVRYGLRALHRNAGFAAVAILTLSLGIGANTAIFSVVNGVLLRPLPYPHADQIYTLWHKALNGQYARGAVSPGNFDDWRRASTTFSVMAAYRWTNASLTGHGEPTRLAGIRSMGSIFEVLQMPPLLGRTFTARDDEPGAAPVIVLSYSTWQRMFGGNASVIGRSILIDDRATTIVGVMPSAFRFPDRDAEFWIPSGFPGALRQSRTEYFLQVVARLRPGASAGAATAELEAIMAGARRAHPRANENVTVAVRPFDEDLTRNVRTRLLVLMGAVTLVLLIAAGNVGNLLLARAATRGREIALRQALGAGRARLVRQLLTESLLLGVLGGAAGLGVAAVLLDLLRALLPADLPRIDEVSIDAGVLAFTAFVSLAAGVLFGLVPALQLASRTTVAAMRDGGRATGRHRLRGALVIAELALAVVLLTGAGLLLKSFLRLQQVDPGFQTARLVMFRVSLPESRYAEPARRLQFFERALESLRRLPGVDSAAIVDRVPVAGGGSGAWLNISGRPLPAQQTPPVVRYQVVSPEYFKTMGIRLVRGRLLTVNDRADHAPSVVISRSLARRFWPSEDPIGRTVVLGPLEGPFPPTAVVGIVEDVKLEGLDAETPAIVYLPHAVMPLFSNFDFVVRTSSDIADVARAATRQIQALDPALPVFGVSSLQEIVEASVAPMRSSMLLLIVFAAVAVVLASIGVFGVVSFVVSQRVREIGIRVALGADPAAVRRLILRQGMRQAVSGVGLGIVGSLALTRALSSLLFGVSSTDPATFAVAAAALLSVAAAACYLPARQATTIDPTVALRTD
jgi:putative ABC transport system permease protein